MDSSPEPEIEKRLACVDLPAFPLQLLLRQRPEWREEPAAVVAEDRPQGRILWANEAARSRRVLPGMRYAAALSLCPGLRAAEVPPDEIDAGVDEVVKTLRRFTPEVEPGDGEPGVFWLDASGLLRLYPSLPPWAGRLRRTLAGDGFTSRVVVGFTRFGTYALARAGRTSGAPTGDGVLVLEDPMDEQQAARRVRLERLGIEPKLRDALRKLGVRTVGDLVELPEGGLGQRFGKAAKRLHRLAAGELAPPLRPRADTAPPRRRVIFEFPEDDRERLHFALRRELTPLLREVAERREAVTAIEIRLCLEGGGHEDLVVRPAAPTLDARQLTDLAYLRFEGLAASGWLAASAMELIVVARGVPARPEQLRLFSEHSRRDLAAAARALARVRAELGPHAVCRARLVDGHLPEASFVWEPLVEPRFPRPCGAGRPTLVRRLLARPRPLPPRPRHEPDGWLIKGLERGPVRRYVGPFIVSGGWWAREIHREYHYAETERGDLLWVFYDRRRRRWYLQGTVE